MKKVIIAILLISLIFLLSGCVHAKITETGSNMTKTSNTKAIISLNGVQFICVDVASYSCGYASVILVDLEGKTYTTDLQNVIIVKEAEAK